MDPTRIPVVVAVGQEIDRSLQLSPVELAAHAAERALAQTSSLRPLIGRITMVNILSRRAGSRPAFELAESCGLKDAYCETTVIGGNMPQSLVNRACADIVAGRLEATLIAGAEALRSRGLEPQPQPQPLVAGASSGTAIRADAIYGTERQDLSDEERAAGLLVPVLVYPLFQSVLSARAGRSNDEERAHIALLFARFTKVAASNPYAWFPEELTACEIASISPGNRLVAEPYVKKMAAFLGSAHGSALVVTSLAVARRCGLEDDAIFVWSGTDAEEVWYPIARHDLGRSPAIGRAARAALDAHGLTADDIGSFDLYSCFPSAVEIAAKEIGIALDDPRGLTVTGGLPYFGGPGSNYGGHSIASMVERLRSAPRPVSGGPSGAVLGLVTGVGWYLTKHSVGIYGTEPPPDSPERASPAIRFGFVSPEPGTADEVLSRPLPVTTSLTVQAAARVEAGTVVYDRDAMAVSAPVIAVLGDGSRIAAVAESTGGNLADVAALGARRSLVGSTITIGTTTPPTYTLATQEDQP